MSPSPLYQAAATSLRAAYDRSAEARNSSERALWQLKERDAFLARLQYEGKRSMFEVVNSLLHVPNSDLPDALAAIRRSLNPGSLFYLGVYGGPEPFEGVLSSDWHVPPRFFSFRTDSQLLAQVEPLFCVEDFHVVEDNSYFQAFTLRALA